MTDSDDKLSRRYRELAREEPSASLDAAILAAARRSVGAGPRSRKSNWMVPTSIAAVLMLGIGVSLRMQLEEPGVETSAPSASSAEYPVPSSEPAQAAKMDAPASAAAPPVPAAKAKPESKALARQDAAPREEEARAAAAEREVAKPLAKEAARPAEPSAGARKDAAEPNPFADAPIAMQPAVPASPPAVALSRPAPARESTTAAGAAAQTAPAPRAKREAVAADNAVAPGSRALGAVADADPARELERIAKLREAARHEEADRALAEFRRRHPDYRIPEAMWERVKPR
jgi:hypothetical protein